MALKFDFSKLRSAMLGFLTPTDALGTALTAGEEAVYVPKMRLGFQVVDLSAAVTLTAEDSGKIFHINGGGAYQVTLPVAASLVAGTHYKFVTLEDTPTADITIAAGSAIIDLVVDDSQGDAGP